MRTFNCSQILRVGPVPASDFPSPFGFFHYEAARAVLIDALWRGHVLTAELSPSSTEPLPSRPTTAILQTSLRTHGR